jgi:hypothetical protein
MMLCVCTIYVSRINKHKKMRMMVLIYGFIRLVINIRNFVS